MADEKVAGTTEDEIRGSVSTLYASIIAKRKQERAERRAQEEEERAARKAEKEAKDNEKPAKLSKKEKREAEFQTWKEIVVGLTGDDLEYSTDHKKKKKKYRKWIGDDVGPDTMKDKDKKHKKKNYRKEFAPELNMLRSIVADQNRFTIELQRRFQNAAGPATKDAMPLNKTLVDLASAVNTSRQNALGYLNAISSIKKTIAELYLKQLKADGTGSGDSQDIALLGSALGNSILGDNAGSNPFMPTGIARGPVINRGDNPLSTPTAPPPSVPLVSTMPVQNGTGDIIIQGTAIPEQEFDPSTWGGEGLSLTPDIEFESIPHTVVMEWNKSTNARRFKAIDSEGKELVGCPVPTSDPYKLKINEKDLIVKGDFAESYKVQIV